MNEYLELALGSGMAKKIVVQQISLRLLSENLIMLKRFRVRKVEQKKDFTEALNRLPATVHQE